MPPLILVGVTKIISGQIQVNNTIKHAIIEMEKVSDLRPGDEYRNHPSTIPDPTAVKPVENYWGDVSKKDYFVGSLSKYEFRRTGG
jgi:hypothetical protein